MIRPSCTVVCIGVLRSCCCWHTVVVAITLYCCIVFFVCRSCSCCCCCCRCCAVVVFFLVVRRSLVTVLPLLLSCCFALFRVVSCCFVLFRVVSRCCSCCSCPHVVVVFVASDFLSRSTSCPPLLIPTSIRESDARRCAYTDKFFYNQKSNFLEFSHDWECLRPFPISKFLDQINVSPNFLDSRFRQKVDYKLRFEVLLACPLGFPCQQEGISKFIKR